MIEETKKPVRKFSDITDVSDLVIYLDSTNQRLSNTDSLYHYTTLESAIKIIKDQKWHLASAKTMNDLREYRNGDRNRWQNLFFSSFMREDKESIGMWSMYAQPWREGVKISIPQQEFKRWIKETEVIHEISVRDYQPTGRKIVIDETKNSKVYISTVVYSNSESLEDRKKTKEILLCGSEKNMHMGNVIRNAELTGYVKDIAWSYEKEVRIKAALDNTLNRYERVAIDIPNYVISAMTITASPLFKGDLREKLEEKIEHLVVKTGQSLFEGNLRIKGPCADCEL